jgi:threonine/homoserine/homoserine lactone efflux protein
VIAPEQLAAFIVVVAVLIAVPGPSVLFVVSRGIALGRRAAVATAVGNEAGLMIQVVAVAFGLGAIVVKSLIVFSIIKLLGALYLIYLGVQAWRHRKSLATGLTKDPEQAAARPGRVFREGFVVGATNPKGLLIFTAVLPQFVDPARGNATLQFLVLGLICITIALISDATWGVLAGTARGWLGRSARRLEVMGGAAGVIMVGLGVELAFTSQRT